MGVKEKLIEAWPTQWWKDVTVLVAVSGGADSVALLRALVDLRETGKAGQGRLVVAHFNHRLRGEESEADQRFVEELAAGLGLQAAVKTATQSLREAAGGQGVEAAARHARYEFLSAAAAEHGARYVATAHTADDQVETVLLNVLRGTGLAGVAGIPRVRAFTAGTALVRPLLDVTHDEVLQYLAELGQDHREDSSNTLPAFLRNRVRRKLLPLLERDYNANVRQSVLRLARVAEQVNDFLEQQARELLAVTARFVPCGAEISCSVLKDSHVVLTRQVLLEVWKQLGWPRQEMSLEKWQLLVEIVRGDGDHPQVVLPGAVVVQRRGAVLHLCRTNV